MPATRARPTHAFASIRVGEASNPGPPPREDLTQASQASSGTDTPPRENPAPLDQEGPDHSDLFFVLPKLILGRPQGAETRKERIARLNRNFQHASQGEWDILMQDALARPEVVPEADDLHPLQPRKTDSHPTLPNACTEPRPRDNSAELGASLELPPRSLQE